MQPSAAPRTTASSKVSGASTVNTAHTSGSAGHTLASTNTARSRTSPRNSTSKKGARMSSNARAAPCGAAETDRLFSSLLFPTACNRHLPVSRPRPRHKAPFVASRLTYRGGEKGRRRVSRSPRQRRCVPLSYLSESRHHKYAHFTCQQQPAPLRESKDLGIPTRVDNENAPDPNGGNSAGGCSAGCASFFVLLVDVWPLLHVLDRSYEPDILLFPVLLGAPAFLVTHVLAIIALHSCSRDSHRWGKRALWILWGGIAAFFLFGLVCYVVELVRVKI